MVMGEFIKKSRKRVMKKVRGRINNVIFLRVEGQEEAGNYGSIKIMKKSIIMK